MPLLDTSALDSTANPTPSYDFSSIFDKVASTALDVGGNYLTQQGQLAIATKAADAQARLNGYSQVNPSLGAVNPAAAAQVAGQTLIQRWLPGGSPTIGVPASGQFVPSAGLKMAVWGGVALLAGLILWKLFRK